MISPSTPIARGIQMCEPNAAGHALGDAGLAVAGGAVQKQAATRVDGRPQPVEHLLVEQQVVERLVQVLGRGMLVRQRLRRDAGDVVRQRDRRRAEVRAMLGEPPGPLATHLSQLIFVVPHHAAAAKVDQLVGLQLMQQSLDQRERKLHLVGDLDSARAPRRQQALQTQLLDLRWLNLRFGPTGGLDRKEPVGFERRLVLRGGLGFDGGLRSTAADRFSAAALRSAAAGGGGFARRRRLGRVGLRRLAQLVDAAQQAFELRVSLDGRSCADAIEQDAAVPSRQPATAECPDSGFSGSAETGWLIARGSPKVVRAWGVRGPGFTGVQV